MSRLRCFVLSGLVCLVISCYSESSGRISDKLGRETNNIHNYASPREDSSYLVTKIVDGDTFWIDNGTKKGLKIRLIGVDAPESRNAFKKKKGYFGKESKEYLRDLILGKRINLNYDVDSIDQYGRTLSYVFIEDGTFVNAELVKNGYAMVMTVPPNVKYQDLFVELQREARVNSRGLWKDQTN